MTEKLILYYFLRTLNTPKPKSDSEKNLIRQHTDCDILTEKNLTRSSGIQKHLHVNEINRTESYFLNDILQISAIPGALNGAS